MPNNHIIERITDFNRGRNPELLKMKYKLMRHDIFAFFRGTCHLFYEDWPVDSPLNNAPLTWISGDLHLENVGSYKGDNGLPYFDINDFDEAGLAPCTWELSRLLVSILVAAYELEISEPEAHALCQYCLDCYAGALACGQVRWVEPETAGGMVRDLLRGVSQRKRKDFIAANTQRKGKKPKLKIERVHMVATSKAQYQAVVQLIDRWRVEQPDPEFYRVLDVAHYIDGTGSLGLEHYAVLVAGNRNSQAPHLLELKAAPVSALEPYLKFMQPSWKCQAERVVTIQRRMQGTPPARLSALVATNGTSYSLRELQPYQDRVQLRNWHGKWRRLESLVETIGEIVAWDEMRSSGRQGSSIADHLIAFAQAPDWREQLVAYAGRYQRQVLVDYGSFCAGYDSGRLA